MKHIFKFGCLCFMALVWAACSSGGREKEGKQGQVGVSWKLVSNFGDPTGTFEARFRLNNQSGDTLSDSNWALFFNMSPRHILEGKTAQPAVLKHLNGDWYKMVPEKGFILAPGDSIEIRYWGTEGVIKETDAPLGPYFVFYNTKGEELQTVQVEDYRIEPFTSREQLLRDSTDRLEAHSPGKIFRQNAWMSEVPADQIRKIIPSPVSFQPLKGKFELKNGFTISYAAGLAGEARLLKEKFNAATGLDATLKEGHAGGDVVLAIGQVEGQNGKPEAYQLQVDEKGIRIIGTDPAGVFYGTQSLLALVPLERWKDKTGKVTLDGVSVKDAPRFGFRSMHFDVSRNFQTKETVLRTIDLLSFYKINHLLLYVTEDEGWRVEIEGLPELTEVGGKRGHVAGKEVAALHPSYGSGPVPNEAGKHGSGFYTKKEFIEILKYAKDRHITVIPELNFPGHARAAIKAMEARYERLMKAGKPEEAEEYRLVDPDDQSQYLSAQFYKDNVVSVARESTYRFYEKVVDAYVAMYKEAGLTLRKFHTGGDEVAEGAWTKSPLAQKLMAADPSIRDPKNLHIYFFRKLLPILLKKGLEVHGWEEIALRKNEKGVYDPNPEFAGKHVVPYIWNNLYDLDLGNRLANAGYPVVLCNVTNFYFDLAYNNNPAEPGLYWGGFVDTRTNWEFAPYDYFKTTFTNSMGAPLDFSRAEKLRPDARKNIIGIESQLWAETVKGREMMEYYILPKLLGFSESAWSPERSWETIEQPEQRRKQADAEWNVFANRLAKTDLPRLAYFNGGYNYRIPAPGAIVENGILKANTELPGLAVRYTTDGSEPTLSSPVYTEPVSVAGKLIRVKAFDASGRGSKATEVNP
ncbi:family 20 glycosylhydrolase [Ravibacter arvi]